MLYLAYTKKLESIKKSQNWRKTSWNYYSRVFWIIALWTFERYEILLEDRCRNIKTLTIPPAHFAISFSRYDLPILHLDDLKGRDGAGLEMEIKFWNPRPTPYHQDNTVPFPPSPFIPKWLPGNCWLHRCCWLPANQITLLGMSQAQWTNPHGSGLPSLLCLAPSLKEAWKCVFKANPGHLS